MEATVLDGVTPEMRLYREESFGPILCVVRVRGVEEAIRVARERLHLLGVGDLLGRGHPAAARSRVRHRAGHPIAAQNG